MADPLVGSGFDLVGSRQIPGQTQAQFYNTQSGLTFENPSMLSNFVNAQYGLQTNPTNVFDTLKTGNVPGANLVAPPNPPNPPGELGGTNLNGTQTVDNGAPKVPNLYDLYQKELQDRGVNTLADQELALGQEAQKYQDVLDPLQPQSETYKFPDALKQYQDVGVNQAQLDLIAARERAPIATALAKLLNSRSLISQRLDRLQQQAQYAMTLRQNDYQNAFESYQDRLKQQQDLAAQRKELGITSQFFKLPGSQTVYNSRAIDPSTGFFQALSYSQYKSLGGSGTTGQSFPDVQTINNNTIDLKQYPTSYQEYLLAKQEGYKGSYNDYQTMDANRKAVRSTTNITYNQQQDQNFQADLATTQNNLNSVAGDDGYVNVTDWKRAYNDWITEGHKASDFLANFSGFVNPNSKDPYFGVK